MACKFNARIRSRPGLEVPFVTWKIKQVRARTYTHTRLGLSFAWWRHATHDNTHDTYFHSLQLLETRKLKFAPGRWVRAWLRNNLFCARGRQPGWNFHGCTGFKRGMEALLAKGLSARARATTAAPVSVLLFCRCAHAPCSNYAQADWVSKRLLRVCVNLQIMRPGINCWVRDLLLMRSRVKLFFALSRISWWDYIRFCFVSNALWQLYFQSLWNALGVLFVYLSWRTEWWVQNYLKAGIIYIICMVMSFCKQKTGFMKSSLCI